MDKIAVFDFDGTIIRGDSVVSLLLFARKKKLLPLFGLLKAAWYGCLYRLKLTDALTAKKRSHAFLARLSQDERDAFLQAFAQTLADRAFPPALRQIQSHAANGDQVLLCSASCQCYMQYVAPLIGADILLSTPCAPDGTVVGPNCRGLEKVNRLDSWLADHGLNRDALTACYGDSCGDAAILRAGGHPVLVNAKRGLIALFPQAERVRWTEKG